MQERVCPNCGRAWYSSAAEQTWVCETCGAEVGPECAVRGDGTGVGWAEMGAICYRVKGIKCNNPACDYRNDTVRLEDWPEWLNKPCPKCGSNLLTLQDLIASVRLIATIHAVNLVMKPVMPLLQEAESVRYAVDMDGTGKIRLRQIDRSEEEVVSNEPETK